MDHLCQMEYWYSSMSNTPGRVFFPVLLDNVLCIIFAYVVFLSECFLGRRGVCKSKNGLANQYLKKSLICCYVRHKASSPGNLKSNRGPFSVALSSPQSYWAEPQSQYRANGFHCVSMVPKRIRKSAQTIHFQVIAGVPRWSKFTPFFWEKCGDQQCVASQHHSR